MEKLTIPLMLFSNLEELLDPRDYVSVMVRFWRPPRYEPRNPRCRMLIKSCLYLPKEGHGESETQRRASRLKNPDGCTPQLRRGLHFAYVDTQTSNL